MSEILLVAVLVLIAVAAVAFPVLVGRDRFDSAKALDARVARYREALEADTVCDRCRAASPAGSRYCQDCGRQLG